jgi:hypothetical protein
VGKATPGYSPGEGRGGDPRLRSGAGRNGGKPQSESLGDDFPEAVNSDSRVVKNLSQEDERSL